MFNAVSVRTGGPEPQSIRDPIEAIVRAQTNTRGGSTDEQKALGDNVGAKPCVAGVTASYMVWRLTEHARSHQI